MVRQYVTLVLIGLLTLIGGGQRVFAQAGELYPDQIEKRFTIYFKLNQSSVDLNFRENNATINEMIAELDSVLKNEGSLPKNLHIIASASPEGPAAINRRLASQRANKVKDFIIKLYPQYKDEKIEIEYVINSWDGVIQDIKKHRANIKNSEKLLSVLENPHYTNKEKDSILRTMPAAFKEIRHSLLDNQRTASITFTIKAIKKPEPVQPVEQIQPVQPKDSELLDILEKPVVQEKQMQQDTVLKEEQTPATTVIKESSPKKRWSPVLRLKTNLLGWAFGHANIAAEINIGKHWTFAIPFYYSGGFNYFKETIKFRGTVIQPEIRYYRSSKKQGLYFGAHYGMGWYNYALDGEFRIQDYKGERPSYGGGLAAGYNWQFKKNPRWGMELALGAGIYDSKYDKFYNEHNGPYAETGIRKTWFGIDNASVSITYTFDFKKNGGRK